MTDQLSLAPGLFLAPTPAGVLHVVTGEANGPAERLLRALLRAPSAPRTDDVDLVALTGEADAEVALAAVASAQESGWLEGRTTPPEVPSGPLGEELPRLLAPLSDKGQAALVDDQGFALSSIGFSVDAEVAVSALAAEVVSLRQRRTTATSSMMESTGWGLVDRHGATTIAIFPLAVGTQQFVLIVGGLPRLNHPAFVVLASALSRRYDTSADEPADELSATPTATGGMNRA